MFIENRIKYRKKLMRTRRNRQVNEKVNREKDKIWNQIGLSKKFKIKGKKTISAAQVIVIKWREKR